MVIDYTKAISSRYIVDIKEAEEVCHNCNITITQLKDLIEKAYENKLHTEFTILSLNELEFIVDKYK